MRFEDYEAQGVAIEQDRHVSREIDWVMQAEREMAERQAERMRVAAYHCAVDGCSGDVSRPWTCCDNCLVVARLARDLSDALDAIGRSARGDQVRRVDRVRQAAARATTGSETR